jgi:hypothetical protein
MAKSRPAGGVILSSPASTTAVPPIATHFPSAVSLSTLVSCFLGTFVPRLPHRYVQGLVRLSE